MRQNPEGLRPDFIMASHYSMFQPVGRIRFNFLQSQHELAQPDYR